MYHQNKMSMASPAYFEIIDFIAAGTTPGGGRALSTIA